MPDAFSHCQELVRDADKDRFLSTLFAPANRRGALFALYAFNSEVARVREAVRQPMAGEIRLQWWRDALERPAAGEARANPVASALLDTVIRFGIPLSSLLALIEARAFDLYDDPMPTTVAVEAYANDTSSRLIEAAVTILDGPHPELSAAIRHGGIAYAVAGLLRAFPLHASRGQLYVPLEMLARHGANPEDIFAGRTNPHISAALGEMRDLARSHLAAFAQAAGALPAMVAPAFLPVRLVPLYLRRLERFRNAPFRLAEVPQWQRQWALWRAARSA
jgi:phytoene synthase